MMTWKIALEKSKNKREKESREWESRAVVAEDSKAALQQQYDSLARRKKMEWNMVVNLYHQIYDFLQLMDQHDNEMHPVNMSLGWNSAIAKVHGVYPDIFQPEDFPIPWASSDTTMVAQAPN